MVSQFIHRRGCLAAVSVLLVPAFWIVTWCPRALAADEAATVAAISELPQYRFEIGQELVYEQTAREDLLPKSDNEDTEASRLENHIKWSIWVTRQNDDGSWRLLIRKQIKMLKIPAEGEPVVRFENDFLGRCDLHPDGTFAVNTSLGDNSLFEVCPEELLIRFPHDSSGLRDGWQYTSLLDEGRYSFAVGARHGNSLQVVGPVVLPYDRSYVLTRNRTVDFDFHRGCVTRIVTEAEEAWQRYPSHNRTTIELTSLRSGEPAWIEQLDREATEYLAAVEKWGALFQKALRARSRGTCQALLDEARQVLVDAKRQEMLQEFRDLFDSRLTLHDREAEWNLEDADRREALYSRDPVDWQTTDFAGNTHRLVDYRGQVVLMDFWYRACGHCILAFPKVKELEARYAGENVVVLGVNKDQDDDDARYIIDRYQLHYPSLRGEDIAKQYGVDNWPTFMVLDQTGRIATIVSGNDDDLVKNISTVVDQLLAHPTQGVPLQDASISSPESP